MLDESIRAHSYCKSLGGGVLCANQECAIAESSGLETSLRFLAGDLSMEAGRERKRLMV
jgi:hypothetical protein